MRILNYITLLLISILTFIVRDKNLKTSKDRSVRILPVLFDHQTLCLKNIEDNDKSNNKTNLCQFNKHTKFPSKVLFNNLCTSLIVALIILVFLGGRAFDHHSQGVGNLITSLNFILRVVLIPCGLINHGGDKL